MKNKSVAALARRILRRKREASKHDFGHLLVVAGSLGMSGAARLCAEAALRSGAGLVTLTSPGAIQENIAGKLTEVMTFPLGSRRDRYLTSAMLDSLFGFVRDHPVTALAVGPGLSRHPETAKAVRRFLRAASQNIVLDADGLNAYRERARELRKTRGPLILTPHSGEMARLLGTSREAIERNRSQAARRLARLCGCVVVLKGHRTVIADDRHIFLNATGNPGMATAGSGDVLCGVIGGFLAQGMAILEAARLGVFVHGRAGDLAEKEVGPVGFLASEISSRIPRALGGIA